MTLPFDSTSESGISSRKRDGGLYCVLPNSIRLHACEMNRRRIARVMPTYASRRSSSISSGSVRARLCGKTPSSTPTMNTAGNSSPFAECSVISTTWSSLVEVVGVGDQRDLLEELVEHGELAGRSDQLAEVLDPAVGLDRVLGLELGEVPGARRSRPAAGRRGRRRRHRPSSARVVEQVDERGDAAAGRPGDAGLLGAAHRLEEGDRPRRGRTRRACATLASPTPRLGTLSTRLTLTSSAGLTTRPQVGHRVLDLAPVVEAGAADHLVRHAHAHERLFDHAALGVGAVEHRDLAPVHGVVAVQLLAVPATQIASSPSSSAW